MKNPRAKQILLLVSIALATSRCDEPDGRDGFDKLDGQSSAGSPVGSPGGYSGGSSQGNSSYTPTTSNTGSYVPKRYPTTGTGSQTSQASGTTVTFKIKAGTGNGPWNDEASLVTLTTGDTLTIVNEDNIKHALHTDGAPCEHGSDIEPGESFDCIAGKIYDSKTSGPLHDHFAGDAAKFWVTVTASTPTPSTSPSPAASNDEFVKAISPILDKSCGGGACHSAGSSFPNLVGNPDIFKNLAASIERRITASGTGAMPPITSGRVLSETDRTVLLQYLDAVQ